MEITRGILHSAKKVVVYGPEGIGKSTFASHFPDPLFIDTEGSTKELDVKRLPAPASWSYLKEEVRYVAAHPDCCRTLVIDTADWAEKLAIQSVLDEHNKNGIEDFGYGNGYRYVYEKFGEVFNLLNDVIEKGINVVITAHAILKKFEQPDEMGAYDRYALKLIDSPKTSISAALKEWADMVLFANYKTIIVTDSKTKKSKAQGGKRVMYTSHHSCWDAKNRFSLPEELPFEYGAIASVIVNAIDQENKGKVESESVKESRTEKADSESIKESEVKTEAERTDKAKATAEKDKTLEEIRKENPVKDEELDKRIPKALRDLMLHDNISEWDIENYTTAKGFVPYDTKIWDYETVNPGIIEGLFVAQWTKVRDQIRQARRDQEIPFK